MAAWAIAGWEVARADAPPTLSAPARPATPQDLRARADWLSHAWQTPPFSFTLGGKSSADLLQHWKRDRTDRALAGRGVEHTTTWADPTGGLEVRWILTEYADYPTCEWTLYFKNGGNTDSPVLADVQAIDCCFNRPDPGEFLLHAFAGSAARADDYAPRLVHIDGSQGGQARQGGRSVTLQSRGKPCSQDLPFFNLEWGGRGAVVAVGWPGSWTARLDRDGEQSLRLRAGMSRLAASLHPGEQIRSPLIALELWEAGDWVRAQNVWRHWMTDYNLPRPGGKLPAPFTATCIDGMFPGMLSNAADEIKGLTAYADHKSGLDYFWIDAGWYAAKGDWTNVGTWEPDPIRYPKGIKQVSDAAHARGMKLVVWHEPERVTPGTWLDAHHPEWLLGAVGGTRLLDLGNPDALKWAVEHFDGLIRDGGVDLYRQDFNVNPADYWASRDVKGRVGITEMRYVEGYLAYWDELRRRHPDMLIDSCASGGQRNDLETLRRSVPLLRSDYRFEPNGTQGHNYGISFWMPFNGTGVEPADPYVMRSHFCACFAYGGPCNDPHFDFDGRNRIAREWRQVADNFVSGDYYPLTDYGPEPERWIAWQFDRPEAWHGVVQAFRRSRSPDASARLKLRGLDRDASYEVRDLETGRVTRSRGAELLDGGLPVILPHAPSAATIAYRRLP